MTDVDTAPVLLVGAGAAGVSAALWLADYGVPFDWIDASGRVGGMLNRVHNRIVNYPGGIFPSGQELCEVLDEQRQRRDLRLRRATLEHFETVDDALCVGVDGRTRNVERLLLATGTAYRQLEIPGELEGAGRWVSQSAAAEASRFAGRRVAVVGGGDAAFENALRLADEDCSVTLLLRSPHRARPQFALAVDAHCSIDVAPIPSVVTRIEQRDEGCRLHIDERGQKSTLDVACLFVRIGVDPVLPAGCETLQSDAHGFLVVDPQGRTSEPGLLAAGDVTSTSLRSVTTAVGQGARAAHCCAAELNYLGPLP